MAFFQEAIISCAHKRASPRWSKRIIWKLSCPSTGGLIDNILFFLTKKRWWMKLISVYIYIYIFNGSSFYMMFMYVYNRKWGLNHQPSGSDLAAPSLAYGRVALASLQPLWSARVASHGELRIEIPNMMRLDMIGLYLYYVYILYINIYPEPWGWSQQW